MNNSVILSVCVPTYNHEKYIRKALEGVFSQKTKYTYEVLVGEDKSVDSTREVLEAIEKDGHKELTVFYREENMFKKELNNSRDLRKRARGKYVIILEGDDYWIDCNKIEMQIDFLEQHPDYIAVSHNCQMVDKDSCNLKKEYKECRDENYLFKHYASDILPGQLTTVMYRNFNYLDDVDTSFFNSMSLPGDRKLYFTLLCYGKVFCIQKKMSAYRYVNSGGSSWSATHKFNYNEQRDWYNEELQFALKVNNKEAIKYADFLLLLFIRQGLICNHSIGIREFFKDLKLVYRKRTSFIMLLKRDINKYLLKKNVFF